MNGTYEVHYLSECC